MCRYKTLEICVESLSAGIAAANAGADRLEVNYALSLGGLTPSTALIKLLKENVDIPLIAMVRPRHGYFNYSSHEFLQMQKEADTLLNAGADGIAFGFLNNNDCIDINKVKDFVNLAGNCETVFHRAFDLLPDMIYSMQQLADLGITRILTSGGKTSAIEGQLMIKKLISLAENSIEILPAGGIRPDNIKDFIACTKAEQIHSSCLQKINIPKNQKQHISFIDNNIKDSQQLTVNKENILRLAELKCNSAQT